MTSNRGNALALIEDARTRAAELRSRVQWGRYSEDDAQLLDDLVEQLEILCVVTEIIGDERDEAIAELRARARAES